MGANKHLQTFILELAAIVFLFITAPIWLPVAIFIGMGALALAAVGFVGTILLAMCARAPPPRTCGVCLEPKGYFVLFSYGSPTERLSYIEESKIDFDVAIKAINKPSLKAALQGGSYDLVIKDFKEGEVYENCHFVYICRKNDA